MKRKLFVLVLALTVGIFAAKAQICEHSVSLMNTQGNGWEGRTLDITVNGIVVLDDITLYSGSGPVFFYFIAETGDDIDAYYTGSSPWGAYDEYTVYDGSGNVLGVSGHGYATPIDILNMVAGNCPSSPTFGISPGETKEYGEYALNNISTGYYTQTYVVRNNGGGTVTVTSAGITGGDESDFLLTDGNIYPVDLLNGETLSFDVTFEPTTIGVKTSTLRVDAWAPPFGINNNITLNGTAYVAPPRELEGTATVTNSVDLTWEVPLPEGELRYDDGTVERWRFFVGAYPHQLLYTKFNAAIAGNLDYIALYNRANGGGTDLPWNAIMVCPDDGTGQPDLVNTYETFPFIEVNSFTGEWILLPLTTPQAMALDDVFYIVTHWQYGGYGRGPFVGIDQDNSGSSAYSEDSGASWTSLSGGNWIMRSYMSSSGAPSAKINAGSPVPDSEFSPVYASGKSSRVFTAYTVHRGDVSGTYNTSFTGIASPTYSDGTASYETTYYYAISSNYSDGTSEFSNEVEVTTPPQFMQPIDQVETNITATSADLGWTEIGTATTWDIEWGATPYTFTGIPTVSGVSNPHNLTGLVNNTEYTWKVRSNYGGGDVSEWEGPSTFTTPVLTLAIPYTQDFESNTFGDYILAEHNTESDIFIDAAAANLSNYGVQMEGNTSLGWSGGSTSTTEAQAWGDNYLHISAMNMIVDATEETVAVLFFDLKQTYSFGANYSWFRVVVNGSQIGVSYNPSSPNSDMFQTISVDLSAYAGTTFNLALQHSGKLNNEQGYGGDNAYVDNIFITSLPCPAPTAQVETNITSTSANLGWTTGRASLWDIEWGAAGFAPGTGTLITGTTTNPHSLTGLTANTSYDWYVKDDCNEYQSTWTGPSTFRTATEAPYFEDFENGGATPSDWTNSSSTGELWLFSTTNIGHSAPHDHTSGAGYFAAVDDSEPPHSTDVTLTTPFIDVSGLAIPLLSFWLYSDNEGYPNMTLKINVWDGAAWNNDFATISTNTGDPVIWQEFFISLSSLSITGPIQVQFVGDETSSGTGSYDDIALDDVSIGEQPDCPAPVSQIETNITTTSADLGWTTGGTNLWDIEWGPVGFTPGTGTILTGSHTNPYSLTGLTANTSYDWYVRDDCGGYQSSWTGPSTFSTACGIITAPYFEDFENGGTTPNCLTNTSSTGELWQFSTSFAGFNYCAPYDHTTGTGYFALVDDSESPHSTDVTLTTPFIDVSGLTSPSLSFWLYSDNAGYTNMTLKINVWDGDSWNNDFATFTGNTGDPVVWQEFIVNLSSLNITGPIQIQFVGDETSSGTLYFDDISLDDITIGEGPDCPAPMTQVETNITATSADLGWATGGTLLWDIEFGESGFTPGTGTLITGTTTNPHLLTGLKANTSYDWYVRDDCGGDQSTWIGPSTFSTAFVAPYFEDFENGGATPNYWTNTSTTGELWLFSTSNIGHSAPYDHTSGSGYFATVDDSEPLYSTDVTLTTPFIDISGLTNPSLSFWLYSDNEGYTNMTLKINVWDGDSWNNDIETFTGNTGDPAVWQEFFVSLSSLSITGAIQVQFVGDETSSGTGFRDDISLDDVTIGEGPDCPAPITQVETNITTTSADLGWATAGASLSDIEWGAAGFIQGTGTQITATTTNPHSITGLTANTSYDWYVRDDCGGDVSTWAGPNSFTTVYTTPFSENFNGIYTPNWWHEAIGDVPTPIAGSSAWLQSNFANNSANSKGVKMFVYDINNDWLITPDIDLGTGNTRIRYKVAATGNNSTNPVTMSAEDTVFVLVKESAGDWSLASPLAYYTNSNTPSNTGDDVAINLTALTGIVNFALYTKGTGTTSYIDIHFDDFIVEEIPSVAVFAISPDSKNYGEFPINNLSSGYYTQTFTVSNSTGGILTTTGTALSAGDASQFVLNDTNNYPVDLAYAETLVFDVTFNATSTGAKTTTLEVSDNVIGVNSISLNGTAYVAPPLDLTGEAIYTPSIDLNWEIPLPEGEIRYDDGTAESWLYVNTPSTLDHYNCTKFNATVTGNLNYVAVYNRNAAAGTHWNAIMVCPDDGFGNPDLANPHETFVSPPVNSTTGEWNLLQLNTPQAMAVDEVFYIVSQWPDGSTTGPYVSSDNDHHSGRSFWTSNGGASWNLSANNIIMRAYMSSSKAHFVKINAGAPVSGSESLPIESVVDKAGKQKMQTTDRLSYPLPGIYASDNPSRALTDYTVHRGDAAATYNTTFTGVSSTTYSDVSVAYETTYFYAITSNYSDGTSDFSNEVQLRTFAEFPQPVDQLVTNITDTSADLGWTENGTATTWNIEYGPAGFTQGSGTMITGTTSKPYQLGGLTAATSYNWYVQSDYGGGDLSDWEGPHTFTTACNSITLFPYIEEFTTGPPDCWNLSGGTFNWVGYAAAQCVEASFNNYIAGKNALLTSPTFDVSGLSSPALWFDWSHAYKSYRPDDELDVLVSDDNGASWTSVWNKVGADLESNDGAGFTTPGLFVSSGLIDVSGFGTSLLIRFNGISGNGNDLFIDNVTIGEGSCPAPTARVVTNITTISADLGWTENGTSTTWDIEWGATPYTFTGTPTVTGVSNPYNLTGLAVDTEYTWKVRSDCGGDVSAWGGPSTFSTHCATLGVPFYEDFAAISTPDCWRNGGIEKWLFSTGAGYDASLAGDHTAGGGTNYAWIDGWNIATNELVTPYIDISSLAIPAFEFYFFSNNTINIGDDNTLIVDFWDGAEWHNLLTYSDHSAAWQQGLFNLSGYTISGDVQFRFVAIETAGIAWYSDMLIDDISVIEFPCLVPTAQVVTITTETSADLGWTENGIATTWNIEYGPPGFTQGSGTIITGTTLNPYQLGGLTTGTSYDWYVQSDCGGGDFSTWAGPHSFSITNDDCSGAITLPVGYTLNWTEGTNVDATDSNNNPDPIPAPVCANYLGGDVWYSAIVPASGYLLITSQAVTGSSLTDGGMAYYTNTCDDLILGGCNDDGKYGLMPEIVINDTAVANETVYIRFWAYGNNTSGVFDITAYTSAPATTWTGATDTDWYKASNWDVAVPGPLTNVTIPAGLTNYPTLTVDAVCNDLTLLGEATVTLSGGVTLICAGTSQ